MVECATSESTSNPAIGIVLTLLACCCYAFGNCLQRYSLLRQKGEKVWILNRHLGWLLGAIIYFSANGIYAVALSFAPVSVLAAVFSLTIVANATCARLILGDTIPPMAYPGYFFVLAGSIVFAVVVNAQVCHFNGNELAQVMTTPQAIIFWVVMGLIIFGGCFFAWRFEKAHPIVQESHSPGEKQNENDADETGDVEDNVEKPKVDDKPTEHTAEPTMHYSAMDDGSETAPEDSINPRKLLLARFLYPTSLGATEAVGALLLKGINSLLTTIATEDKEDQPVGDQDYPEDLGLWIGLIGVGVCIFLGIVLWLRLTYSRFEITGAFPVEFGMLTFASVVGGFAVFQDYHFVSTAGEWIGVGIAGACILGGISIVGYASWRAKVAEDSESGEEKKEEHPVQEDLDSDYSVQEFST